MEFPKLTSEMLLAGLDAIPSHAKLTPTEFRYMWTAVGKAWAKQNSTTVTEWPALFNIRGPYA